jgi:hypothetical protein
MENCKDCNTEYNPDDVTIPLPIPDYMCAICGTQLTQEEAEVMAGENDGN